jgi:hypothetical protein
MSNLFDQLNHDQLHTLATALGNTITRLYERKDDAIKLNATELAAYLYRCINDAAQLLEECETAFNDLGFIIRS